MVCFSFENFFCNSFLYPEPSSWNCLGVNVTCFRQLHLTFGHLSWTFKTVPTLFETHHAAFDIAEQCFFYICFQANFSFCHLCSKILTLALPQRWPFLFLTFLVSFALRFIFSFWMVSLILDFCFPPHNNFVLKPFIYDKNECPGEHLLQNKYIFFFLGINRFIFIIKISFPSI